jgi:hypothetical protein
VFTKASHLSLPWVTCIQSTPFHPISLRSILMLYFHLRLGLPSGLFLSCFPTKILYALLISHVCYIPRPFHPPLLCHPSNISWRVQVMMLLIMQSSPVSCHIHI